MKERLDRFWARYWLRSNKKPAGPMQLYATVAIPWLSVGMLLSATVAAIALGLSWGLIAIGLGGSLLMAVNTFWTDSSKGLILAIYRENLRQYHNKKAQMELMAQNAEKEPGPGASIQS